MTKGRAAVAFVLLFFSSEVIAADSGRDLAANCAACHGTAGESTAAMPRLAGIDKTYFVQQMRAFKSGERSATIMHQIAKGYSETQVNAMANYFAAQTGAKAVDR